MFARGLVAYLPANIVQGLIGVLTILVFTRLLTAEQFGAYALAYAVFSLAHTAVFSWVEAAMARYWAAQETPEKLADLYRTLYRLLLILTVLFIPAVVIGMWLLPISDLLRWPIAIALVGIPVRSAMNMVRLAQQARGDVVPAALLGSFYSIGGFIFGVIAIYLGTGAAAPMLGLLVAPLLALPLIVPPELKYAKGGTYRPAILKSALKYGYPVSVSLGMATVLASTDRFMIQFMMGEAAVGAYHASFSLANRALDVLFIWLGSAGGPALVMALERDGKTQLQHAALVQAKTILLITMPAAVGVALVAEPLSGLMIGSELKDSAAAIMPYIAASAFFSGLLYYYFNQAFSLSKRTDLLVVSMIFPIIANIGFNLVLIPRMGLEGAALSTLLSFIVGVISSVIIARRILPMPVPWLAFFQCAVCCSLMALAILALPNQHGIADLAQNVIVGVAVYGLAVIAIDAASARSIALRILNRFRSRAQEADNA